MTYLLNQLCGRLETAKAQGEKYHGTSYVRDDFRLIITPMCGGRLSLAESAIVPVCYFFVSLYVLTSVRISAQAYRC